MPFFLIKKLFMTCFQNHVRFVGSWVQQYTKMLLNWLFEPSDLHLSLIFTICFLPICYLPQLHCYNIFAAWPTSDRQTNAFICTCQLQRFSLIHYHSLAYEQIMPNWVHMWWFLFWPLSSLLPSDWLWWTWTFRLECGTTALLRIKLQQNSFSWFNPSDLYHNLFVGDGGTSIHWRSVTRKYSYHL